MTAKIPENAAFGRTVANHLPQIHGAAVCLADVQSANVVGYESINLRKDGMTMFGMQFEGVSGESITLKELSGNFNGGPGLADADNIIIWKDGVYSYYYYGVWGDPDYPEWDNLWYDDESMDASDVTIDPGMACWYVRIGDGTPLTIAGAVKLTPTAVTVRANGMTMFTCPYPTSVKLSELNVVNPFGGPGLADADNIIIWKDGVYSYYYYGVWGDPDYPEWDNLWYDDESMDASDVTIDPGIAAWYVRIGDATIISFTSPLAK